jgi:pimeloyl-ACP methyl ester carboxylesterase
METKYLLYKKAKIAYSDQGSGNIIVLLHGFLESSVIWEDFTIDLSKQYRVITIDLPGHGQSESMGYIHRMELMAECVNAVIAHLIVSNFLLIGHSMGGYVSLAIAEKCPLHLKGLILFHSSAMADDKQKKESRLRAIEAAKQNTLLYINATIPNLFKTENLEKFKPQVEKIKSIARSTSQQGVIAALDGMRRRKNRRKVLKSFAHPVLFISGRFDNAVPLKKVLTQLPLAPHTEALILNNVGHMGFIEARAETLLTIQAFASKVFI